MCQDEDISGSRNTLPQGQGQVNFAFRLTLPLRMSSQLALGPPAAWEPLILVASLCGTAVSSPRPGPGGGTASKRSKKGCGEKDREKSVAQPLLWQSC